MALMVIVAVAIVGAVVWAVAARRPGDRQLREPSARDSSRATARRAVRAGEIDTREYRERPHALRGNAAGT